MNKMQFAKALIKLGWTQEEAGFRLDCHERTIRSYVIGEHKVSFKAEQLLRQELEARNMRVPR